MIRKCLLAFSIVMLLAVVGVLCYGYYIFFAPNVFMKSEKVEIFIPTGSDYNKVEELIVPYLKRTATFRRAAYWKDYCKNVRAGRYELRSGMSNTQLIAVLRNGNKSVRVRFNNQDQLSKLAARVAQQIEADSSSLMKAFTDTIFLKDKKISPSQALAMYIPNTYEFYWNTSAERFRERMFREYEKFWNDTRKEKARKQGLNPLEVAILASIVQKETRQDAEKPVIAGVYLNRLRKGMLLQADPTVIYAIKEQTGAYDTIIRRVLYKDLEINSPYNTYKYLGLPPGPIAMPDIASVEAVLNPQQHEYLYFVADPYRPGFHKFSETLSQHNKNKEIYLQWLRKQGIKR